MTGRLQAEIKQSKPFPSPTAEALLGILRTAAVLDHHLAEALKPYGITTTQYNVLRILRGAGQQGLCGREVAERLLSKVPDVSRLLDRTEELGLIKRERDPRTDVTSPPGLRRRGWLCWRRPHRRWRLSSNVGSAASIRRGSSAS